MSIERGRGERVAELFNHALSLDGADRAAFLESLHDDDEEIAVEVDSLLATHHAAPHDLETLAAQLLPEVLEKLSQSIGGELKPNQAIGHYQMLERLGSGGIAEVYRARDLSLDRLVALKFLPAHLTQDAEARARLTREARAASALDHPNIAVVYEIGATETSPNSNRAGQLFIAMAHYTGETIKQMIARAPLPIADALDYASQVSAGLEAAHEVGVVHRDIKPANLIVTERQQVKILDFGIAKLAGHDITTEGGTLGTIAYMSPEQTRGTAVDARSDLWSLGVVLYEMLTGRRPFLAEDGAALLQAIRHDPHTPLRELRPDAPEALERIVERCLRKDPLKRYASASALRHDLLKMAGASGRSLAETLHDRGRLEVPVQVWRGRSRALVALVIAAVAIGAVVFALPSRSPPAPVDASASTILVLPFLAPANDTSLARLGRDLAITLSATLDGIGDVRTIDASTMFAQLLDRDAEGPITVNRSIELARRLGAGTVLVGSVIRDGSASRADTRLVRADGAATLARAVAVAAPDSLGALTDSLAVQLVHELWRGGNPPVPSLGAITTRSATALRAYVNGEQALASGDMARAVGQFERAFAADSTFWFAYWRSLYPRIYEGSRPDTAIMAEVFQHRDELPERDRLLIEARLATTVTARANALRALTDRYLTYWPAAYELANHHVHATPFVGSLIGDARTALERVVALNPRFTMAWHHLFWITASQEDNERSRAVLEALEGLVDPAEPFWEASLIQFRTIVEALDRGGEVAPETEVEMAGLIQRVADQVPGATWGFGVAFVPMGLAALQIRVNRRVLATNPMQVHAADLHMATAMAWATRGAWDSVAVELDSWMRLSTDPRDALRAYGLGVLGALLDGWEPDRATSLRRAAADAAAVGDAHDRAELAWLDGVFASLQSDTVALAEARNRIRRSDATHAARLDASLHGFQQAATEDESTGARTLERIELEAGERWAAWDHSGRHPYLFAVNRLQAAQWLLSAGDTTAAARLLEWYHGVLGTRDSGRDMFATFTVLPFVFTELARIAEARGRAEEAAGYRLRIVRSFDLPSSPEGRAILAEATAALARVAEVRR